MIGLPFQTVSDLADDLIFFRDLDIDMVGMGPYIEHKDTPLYEYRNQLLPLRERLQLSLKMVAVLRIMMKDINIAATTALQAIDPMGREKALQAGANVIMPNLTPVKYRQDYLLYENKPCLDEEAEHCKSCLETRIQMAGDTYRLRGMGRFEAFPKTKPGPRKKARHSCRRAQGARNRFVPTTCEASSANASIPAYITVRPRRVHRIACVAACICPQGQEAALHSRTGSYPDYSKL